MAEEEMRLICAEHVVGDQFIQGGIVAQRHGDDEASIGREQGTTGVDGGADFFAGIAFDLIIKTDVLEGGNGNDEREALVGLPLGDISIDDVWGGFVFVDDLYLLHI